MDSIFPLTSSATESDAPCTTTVGRGSHTRSIFSKATFSFVLANRKARIFSFYGLAIENTGRIKAMANNRITQSPLRPPSHLMMRRFVTYSSNCRDTKVLTLVQ